MYRIDIVRRAVGASSSDLGVARVGAGDPRPAARVSDARLRVAQAVGAAAGHAARVLLRLGVPGVARAAEGRADRGGAPTAPRAGDPLHPAGPAGVLDHRG